MADLRIEHSLDEETLTLRSESFPEDEKGAAVLETRWETSEKMDAGLPIAVKRSEERLRDIVVKANEEVYAGPAAVGARSSIRRVNLPFGLYVALGKMTGQEYDEGAVIFGPVKFNVSLKLTGGFYWRTLRVLWRSEEPGMVGFGGASTARFMKFGRQRTLNQQESGL